MPRSDSGVFQKAQQFIEINFILWIKSQEFTSTLINLGEELFEQ